MESGILDKKVCLINLGCKVNKYELDCVATILKEKGYTILTEKEKADYYVVNTCAVTNEAEKKSRQYIGKLSKLNPDAKIVVMGCASQANPKQFQNKDNVISVSGTTARDRILEYIEGWNEELPELPKEYTDLGNPTQTKTRAYLKIQDGCNNFCSYCIIPYIRGRSRSRDLEDCLKEAKILSLDSKEIVVAGIDMSSYTINNQLALGTLMRELGKVKEARFRIGSLEVGVVTKEFLEDLKSMPNFCPHFHLSLQSASDKVLYKMNRHYTFKEYYTKVKMIRKYFPNANITTDLIVGFPTEDDKEFRVTKKNVKKIGFGDMHIFPFSMKSGTVASRLKDLDGTIKKERVHEMEKIAQVSRAKYLKKNIGKTHCLLIEEQVGDYFVGYTENYIKTYIKGNFPIGEIVKIKTTTLFQDGMLGCCVEE